MASNRPHPHSLGYTQFESAPGFLPCLVSLLGYPDIPFHIRQSAAVRVKLLCRMYWAGPRSKHLNDQDRAAVRSSMVQLLCSQHEELIRVQLAECFFVIARNDFPAQWPTALDEAVHALTNAPNPQSLYGALLAYNQLCKVYRTALNDKDAVVLEEICNKGMSIVLNLLQETTKQKTPEAYAFAHLAIKTVNYCLYIRVPAFFKPIATMDSLMQMLLSIAAAEIPAELVHTLYEQRQLKM